MSLTCTEIMIEIWISFSGFIRSGSVLPQQKCSAMFFFLAEAYNFLNGIRTYLSIYLSIWVCLYLSIYLNLFVSIHLIRNIITSKKYICEFIDTEKKIKTHKKSAVHAVHYFEQILEATS